MGEALYHFMGEEPIHRGTSHSEDDIRKMVSASEKGGSIDPVESRLIDNVFDFADRVAREVMVPRQDMVCLFVDDPIEENMKVIRESGHTRYPLCEEDRDHILGMIHIREFMNADYKQPGFDLRSIMREIDVVPESMSIAKILQLMQHKHVQMAAVADEYGGTAGLVTMEDLLETIVGDLDDEHEDDNAVVTLADGVYEVGGDVPVNELEGLLGEDIFENADCDTIGGFITETLGRIPQAGETLPLETLGYTLTVAEATPRAVTKVTITRTAEKTADPQPAPEQKRRFGRKKDRDGEK